MICEDVQYERVTHTEMKVTTSSSGQDLVLPFPFSNMYCVPTCHANKTQPIHHHNTYQVERGLSCVRKSDQALIRAISNAYQSSVVKVKL